MPDSARPRDTSRGEEGGSSPRDWQGINGAQVSVPGSAHAAPRERRIKCTPPFNHPAINSRTRRNAMGGRKGRA